MEDYQIVELYWKRDQQAIRETENKYGHYLTKIALNILADLEDSKESGREIDRGIENRIIFKIDKKVYI